MRLPDETYQRPQTKPRFQVEGKRAGHLQSAKTAATQSIYKEDENLAVARTARTNPNPECNKKRNEKKKIEKQKVIRANQIEVT